MKPKLLIVVGPTASGKSEFAVKLAKTPRPRWRRDSGHSGEIISADSRQVYRGLNIGTGKVAGRWQKVPGKVFVYKKIPHYCIDFVPPQKTYTVVEFKKCADLAIRDIISRGKIPILAGGTGFWIDAVVYDLKFPQAPPNHKLRRKLEKKSAAELLRILQKLDPERAKTIEPKNPRRIIRAIEVAKVLGRVPTLGAPIVKYRAVWLGLNPSPYVLRKNISRRAKKMIQGGLIRETRSLLKKRISDKRIHELGFEYRAALDYIDKKINRKELYERLVKDALEYARRQMSWWRLSPKIRWRETNAPPPRPI